MLTIQHTEHFRIETPTIVTIGTFDGVHLGHRKILDRLRDIRENSGLKTVVLTFEPHPRKVLFPEQKDLRLLTLVDEKLELLSSCGVDVTVVYPFSKKFAELDAMEYVSTVLIKSLNVKHLVIGYDHKFGKGRSGDIQTLKKFSTQFGFEVEEISVKDIDNISISSSKIRKALEEGNVSLASDFLGHPYSLTATVIKGKQLGRQLGYPTANLKVEGSDKLLPKNGIYFVSVRVKDTEYYGMMNIGTNPTTDTDQKIKPEVHIFDFDKDIYSQPVTLQFIKRLRDEEKFENLDALKTALDNDKTACLRLMETIS